MFNFVNRGYLYDCITLKRFSFAQRIVKTWNFLPETVINAPSVASFKKQLDKIELERFLQGWEPPSLY